jgi:hypothetical protein
MPGTVYRALPTRNQLATQARGQNCATPGQHDRRARQFFPPYDINPICMMPQRKCAVDRQRACVDGDL